MNWNAVRKQNARSSARKAKREAADQARRNRIEREGGPIKVDELRNATRRQEPRAQGLPGSHEVWGFRDRDWVIGFQGGIAYPYRSWRVDGCDIREGVPMTTGATKWFMAQLPANEN